MRGRTGYARTVRGRQLNIERGHRYRARKAALPVDGSGIPDWLDHAEETDTWACHLCGGALAATDIIHWDHRDPVAGGEAGTVVANMSAAHEVCNLARGNVPIDVWHDRVGVPDGVI